MNCGGARGNQLLERTCIIQHLRIDNLAVVPLSHSMTPKRTSTDNLSAWNSTLTKPIFTIGHSTRTVAELVVLLRQVDVGMLVDVRSIPRSRATPQFNLDVLPEALAAEGIGYRHLCALGGRRSHPKGAPPSTNTLWRVMAFRHYADYAETDAFRAGLDELLELSAVTRCAIMCAEAVWWRCHRRIIADYLLGRGIPVGHIMAVGQVTPATLTPGAQVHVGGTVRYPAPDQ